MHESQQHIPVCIPKDVLSEIERFAHILDTHLVSSFSLLLFGSYRTGKATYWSDIDIAVDTHWAHLRQQTLSTFLIHLTTEAEAFRIQPVPIDRPIWYPSLLIKDAVKNALVVYPVQQRN